MQETSSIQNQKLNTILLLIVLFVLLIAAYVVIRYEARRIDGDTALLIISSKDLMQSGSLTSGKSYRFGFNYPVINSILSLMTGMSIYSLVTFFRPEYA